LCPIGINPVFFVTIADGRDEFAPEYMIKYFRTKEAMEAYVTTVEDDELVTYGQMPEVGADIPF
jgi:hypothetical protein